MALVGCEPSNEEIRKTYFPNGILDTEVTYVGESKNGPFVYYNREGLKWKEGFFLNDTLDGTLLNYSSNGIDTNRITTYKNGEIIELIDYTSDAPKIKINHKEKLITIYDELGKVDSTIEMK